MGLKEILATFVLRFVRSSLDTGRDRVGFHEWKESEVWYLRLHGLHSWAT